MIRADPALQAEQLRKVLAFEQWANKERNQRVLWVVLAITVLAGCAWGLAARHSWPVYAGILMLIATYPASELIARRWAERSFKSDAELSPILTIGQCVWHGEREPGGKFNDQSKAEVGEWARALLTDKKWGPKVRQHEWLMRVVETRESDAASRS